MTGDPSRYPTTYADACRGRDPHGPLVLNEPDDGAVSEVQIRGKPEDCIARDGGDLLHRSYDVRVFKRTACVLTRPWRAAQARLYDREQKNCSSSGLRDRGMDVQGLS